MSAFLFYCILIKSLSFHLLCDCFIPARFMKEELLSQVIEALLVIRGLIVQKTKVISDCNRLLKDLLDGLMLESTGNKRKFIHACISGLQNHVKEKKGRTKLVRNVNI